MQPLTRIIYTSAAAPTLDPESLKRLVKSARGNNAALCVTSVLVQSGSRFLQVLEGNADTVGELFARIARDQHHTGVSVLVREPADHRLFGDWPLGLSVLSSAQVARLAGANQAGITELCVSELNVGRAKHLLTALTKKAAPRASHMPASAAA